MRNRYCLSEAIGFLMVFMFALTMLCVVHAQSANTPDTNLNQNATFNLQHETIQWPVVANLTTNTTVKITLQVTNIYSVIVFNGKTNLQSLQLVVATNAVAEIVPTPPQTK